MRICDNGVYRDATSEEMAAFDNTPEPGTVDEDVTAEEIAAAIEEALA